MHCNFSLENCQPECKKFSLCALQFEQEKLIEVQKQISVLSQTINVIANTMEKNQADFTEKLNDYTAEILKLIKK